VDKISNDAAALNPPEAYGLHNWHPCKTWPSQIASKAWTGDDGAASSVRVVLVPPVFCLDHRVDRVLSSARA
jgi:hypothetical protein